MALIKCKECGHEVSDKAFACPNCGCPMENVGATQEEVMDEEPKKTKGWIWALIVAVLLCILVGGYYGYAHYANSEDEVDSIYVDNNKYAIVELTPKFIKALEVYDELTPFSEGYAAVKRGGKWGYINTKGEEIIPCKYEEAEGFREGCAKVREGAVSSYINTKGEDVTPKKFSGKTEKEKGMLYEVFSINDDNNWGLKDANGSIIIDAVYSGIDIGKGLWATENRGTISNGVVLVVLDELKDTYDNTDGAPTDNDIIRHYGYADLKGNDTFTGHAKSLLQKEQQRGMQQEEYYGGEDKAIVGTYFFNPCKDNYASVDMYNGSRWWKERKLVGYIKWSEYLVVMDDFRVTLLTPDRKTFVGNVTDVSDGAFVISIKSRENASIGAWTPLYKNGRVIGRLLENGYGYPKNVVIDTKTKRIYNGVENYMNKDISDVEYIMYENYSSEIKDANNTEYKTEYLNKSYEREYSR